MIEGNEGASIKGLKKRKNLKKKGTKNTEKKLWKKKFRKFKKKKCNKYKKNTDFFFPVISYLEFARIKLNHFLE